MENKVHVVLTGCNRDAIPGSTVLSKANPDEVIELTVKLRRKAKLPEITAHPAQTISLADLEAQYGASDDDINQVKEVLTGYGLTIGEINQGTRTLRVSGTIGNIEAVFMVNLFHSQHAEKGNYRGRTGDIHIPAVLEGIIEGVFGLDNHPIAKEKIHHNAHLIESPTTIPNRSWFYPEELAKIYNFPEGDGSGQTIGVLEFGGGYFPDDFAAFCKSANIPVPTVIPVSVNQAPTDQKDGNEVEVMLDIEVMAGVCPKATIVVYFSSYSEQGWVDAIDTVIHDTTNHPHVISVSWGQAEDGQGAWTEAARNAINDTLQEAAALGITVCVATGDDGSSDAIDDGPAHADFPSCSPYVLAVGGTALTVENNNVNELVWKEGTGLRKNGGGASGGGVSVYFPRPSWQQVNVASVNPGAINGRCIPDVCANACRSTGYFIVVNGKGAVVGGTSAAAPLWAALISRINAQLGAGKKVGYLTPLLYSSGTGNILGTAACNGVKTGDNATAKAGGYAASPGYNAASGWGSPNGKQLLAALKTIL